MQINNTNNINFKGIYKLPKTQQNIKEIVEYVEPTFSFVRHEKLLVFEGNNPFKVVFDDFFRKLAKENGANIEWLKMNAKNYGINLYDMGDDVIHVISGNKEISKFADYLVSMLPKKEGMIDKIKHLFTKDTAVEATCDLPEHLKFVSFLAKENERVNASFSEYAKDVVSLNNAKELFKRVLSERL